MNEREDKAMEYQLSNHIASLLAKAKAGDWDHVDAHLRDGDILSTDLKWAIYVAGMMGVNEVRDFAATLLDVSTLPLSEDDMRQLEAQMGEEDSDIVRLRVAIALYKRDSKWPRVRQYFDEALQHPDLKAVAERFRKAA
jgi:hypothetical protein